ncbi:MAG: hypothetical protein MUF76_16045 [Hydrogenophaga sp.]|nr:hypothetical protein [Hydrogenophaga sp.]
MMEMAVTAAVREKFSSQAAPEVLAALRQIAESQGRMTPCATTSTGSRRSAPADT